MSAPARMHSIQERMKEIRVLKRKRWRELTLLNARVFFVTFPEYVNGVLETSFCSQITFGQAGREQKFSKLAYFRKGGPCRDQYEGKITNTNKC